MDNRPHARQKAASSGAAKVVKRAAVSAGRSGGGMTRGRTLGGGSLVVALIILVILFSGGATSSEYSDSEEYSYTGSQSAGAVSYSDTDTADVDETVSSGAREKYTVLKGGGSDSATVMVYICGSNLESDNGMATSDLNEMASAALKNDKVHVVVETGGAKKWRNSVISSRHLGRYEVVEGGLKPLETGLKSEAMTEPGVLTDFIRFAAQEFPADRYMLILWDHGGGSVSGFGYDERYPNGSMRLDGVAEALKDSGVKFDFVGFDACLMAGMETAIALAPYADYLVASEETEPGTGWYYTNWLSQLSVNPSTPTTDIGKHIIDDFVERSAMSGRTKVTLSLTDLADFSALVPSKLQAFGNGLSSELESDNYQTVADARADTKEFSSKIDQVDVVDFCDKLNTSEAKELSSAVKKSVKYNRTANVDRAYGMSFYFPYSSLRSMKSMTEIYDNIEMDEAFSESVKSFAMMESSGQIASTSTQGGQGSLIGSLMMGGAGSSAGSGDVTSLLLQALVSGSGARNIPVEAVDVSYEPGYPGGGTDYESILGDASWISESDVRKAASYVEDHSLNGVDLSLTEKDGQKVLHLSEDEWKKVKTMELSVFCKDGSGYVDLGLDNTFEFDDDGDLVASYDGTWLALDSHICCYYMTSDKYEEDGSYVTEGFVPAFINGMRADIILQFTDQDIEGKVLGYRRVNENGVQDKGIEEIAMGSEIELLCDFYDRSGHFDDRYYLGEPFEAGESVKVSMMDVEDGSFRFGYRLTDLYGNHYWTEMQ